MRGPTALQGIALRTLAPGVHVAEAPQRFLGLEVGARRAALELDGGLLVHAPLAIDPASLAPLGQPRWVVTPHKLHHLYVGPWADAVVLLHRPGRTLVVTDLVVHFTARSPWSTRAAAPLRAPTPPQTGPAAPRSSPYSPGCSS